MRKIMTVVLATLMVAGLGFAADNTPSKLDMGLRLGIMNNFGGITARYALSETSKIEADITTVAFNGVIFTGMYQIHNQIGDVNDLSWYFGGGLHLGYWQTAPRTYNSATATWINNDFALGLDAIVGIQYNMSTLIDFPLLISLDYKPSLDVLGKWSDNLGDVALSIRYAF